MTGPRSLSKLKTMHLTYAAVLCSPHGSSANTQPHISQPWINAEILMLLCLTENTRPCAVQPTQKNKTEKPRMVTCCQSRPKQSPAKQQARDILTASPHVGRPPKTEKDPGKDD